MLTLLPIKCGTKHFCYWAVTPYFGSIFAKEVKGLFSGLRDSVLLFMMQCNFLGYEKHPNSRNPPPFFLPYRIRESNTGTSYLTIYSRSENLMMLWLLGIPSHPPTVQFYGLICRRPDSHVNLDPKNTFLCIPGPGGLESISILSLSDLVELPLLHLGQSRL